MMNCPKCKKNMVGDKKVRDKENGWDIARGAAFVFGGPLVMTVMAVSEGVRVYDRFVRDEVQVKCPHCGETITLTKAQYKQLKKEIRELTQNRIK